MTINVTDYLDWATRHALVVADSFGLIGADREDVVSVAHLTLCQQFAKPIGRGGFDVGKYAAVHNFRAAVEAWAYRWVRTACVREAKRIKGGGTFRTKKDPATIYVDSLGDACDDLVDQSHDEPRDMTSKDETCNTESRRMQSAHYPQSRSTTAEPGHD